MNKMRLGSSEGNVLSLVVAVSVMLGLAAFGGWSFIAYLDAKDNLDAKVAEAVAAAEQSKTEELNTQFAEREKEPYETYVTPSETGSVSLTYPRTWSAYVDESGSRNTPLDGYFHPQYVPANKDTAFALRVTISNAAFSQEVGGYDRDIENGSLTSSPVEYEGVNGVLLEGNIEKDLQGAMIILPIRDKTVRIWTESTRYLDDFTNIVRKNLSFTP